MKAKMASSLKYAEIHLLSLVSTPFPCCPDESNHGVILLSLLLLLDDPFLLDSLYGELPSALQPEGF